MTAFAGDMCLDDDLIQRAMNAFRGDETGPRMLIKPAIIRVLAVAKAHYAQPAFSDLPAGPSPRERGIRVFSDALECGRNTGTSCLWRGDEPCHCRLAADREAEGMT